MDIFRSFAFGGKFTSRGAWSHPRRTISSSEIIIVTEGNFSIRIGSDIYNVTKGDALTLPREVEHSGVGESDGVSFFWLHFHGDVPSGIERLIHPERPDACAQLARELLHYSETEGYPPECADAMLTVLFCELAKPSCGEVSSRLAIIKEWAREGAEHGITATEVAEHFLYNEDYLAKIFKREFGIGIKAFIDGERIRRIKQVLCESDLSLKEISERFGFHEYKYFLKFFKYHSGISPSKYKSLYYNLHTNRD